MTNGQIVGLIMLGLVVTVFLTFFARILFEDVLKRKTIIKFENAKEYNIYFTFIFFCLYIPGLNLISILSFLIILEIDNLKQLKRDVYGR
jgi:hypothetical protein